MTTQKMIRQWFRQGLANNNKWMIIVCDTFDYDDYPVYADSATEFWNKYDEHNGKNMQSIMETYNLEKDMESQIGYGRCHETP